MKIVMITVIDTDKQFCDSETYEIPSGKLTEKVDLGDIMLGCQMIIAKIVKKTKEESD